MQSIVKIEENINLLPFNTFGVDVRSKYLCQIDNTKQLIEIINNPIYKKEKHFILGGGSNVLFGGDFDGLVIKTNIKGIKQEKETNSHIWIKVYAGEMWSHLVTHAVSNNWGGIENLALIPGTAGAAPIQNIGAYGVEIKNVLDAVEAIELSTGVSRRFTKQECELGYRDSIFKNSLKGKFFISSITLALTKKNHLTNTTYGTIKEILKKENRGALTIKSISEAVTQIRQRKLPDPKVIGNAGSFFKNPIISLIHYQSLQRYSACIPNYPVDEQRVKIPAGWLIEKCGWKGKRIGAVGVHPDQSLILVNYGGGSGQEIVSLAKKIKQSVFQKFQIKLIPEITIV